MHVILYLSWPWANRTNIVKPSLVLWRFLYPSRPSFPFSLQCSIPKASSESDRPREVETALNHLLRKLVRLPMPDELLLSNDCEPGSASWYDVNTPSLAMNLALIVWRELTTRPRCYIYVQTAADTRAGRILPRTRVQIVTR